jgi:SAM-dependent methyltransferase
MTEVGKIGTAWQRLARSEVAWRISGLTYATAVRATHGQWVSPRLYLEECRTQMGSIAPYISNGARVLEYGCGLGGNLLAISPCIIQGSGVDLNPGFLRHARRLARQEGVSNISFSRITNEAETIPGQSFDFSFTIGVFERLSRRTVEEIIRRMRRAMAPRGLVALYFLSERATHTSFTEQLGDGAYVFWSDAEILEILDQNGLQLVELFPWSTGGRSAVLQDSPATMAVARLTS